jgi:biotin synthase
MRNISSQEALEILKSDSAEFLESAFRDAGQKREGLFGKKIELCSIINAKCGNCSENCAFCAQSASSGNKIKTWPLVSPEEIFRAAEEAEKAGVSKFGIVTSGTAVSSKSERLSILRAVEMISSRLRIKSCASLGVVSGDFLRALKDGGLFRYHHNLECAESLFPQICSTRTYSVQIKTVELARKAGLSVCSGGIFGLGESPGQRIELLETLRSLQPDSVPVNFLSPVKGTRLESMRILSPEECLRIIAAARLMLPVSSVRICGGRGPALRSRQSEIFAAGADALMTGGYLTTPGASPADDSRMIHGEGLEIS